MTATVVSAVPLTTEQINKITQKLISSLNKQIQIETQIDPSIIGGLKIRVGDRILDASIEESFIPKSQLYDLQLV